MSEAGDVAPGAFARLLLNGYVALFAAEGLVQGLGLFIEPLMPLVFALGGAVLVASLGMVALWVVMARLPYKLLVAFVALGWISFGMMPLPAILLSLKGVSAAGVAVHLLVAWGLLGFRTRGLMAGASLRDGPDVSLPVSAGRVGILMACAIGAVFLQLWSVAWSLNHVTDGYVRVDRTGLETAHRACTHGGKTIHLVGAVHVGEDSGYKALLQGIPESSLLLAEGVTDVDGHLGDGFGYGKLAGRLGLRPQRSEDVGGKSEGGGDAEIVASEGEGRFRVRSADVDVNVFQPATLDLLAEVGGILGADDPVAAYIKGVGNLSAVNEDTLGTVIDDILVGRNEHLLGVIDEVLPGEDELVVPWGAMHLRDVGRGLSERGFVCGEPRYVRMITWSTVRNALMR